jgi:hypothetical protein
VSDDPSYCVRHGLAVVAGGPQSPRSGPDPIAFIEAEKDTALAVVGKGRKYLGSEARP